MDALIHTTDPYICPIPSDTTLTGQQIMLLAKHLDLSTKELVTLIEQVKQVSLSLLVHYHIYISKSLIFLSI